MKSYASKPKVILTRFEEKSLQTPFTFGKCSSLVVIQMMPHFWKNILHFLNNFFWKFEKNNGEHEINNYFNKKSKDLFMEIIP
jgi:hypothetical protein